MSDTDELRRRIEALETAAPSKKESWFLRFGALAGVVGTLISILVGGLSLYSETVRKTDEDRQALYTQFQTRIDEIIADNQKLSALTFTKEDQPGSRVAAAMTINSAKLNTLVAARALLPRIESLVTVPQLVLIATETAQTGDNAAARIYMARAVQVAEPPLKPEALRMEGRMFMLSNDPNDRAMALADFAKAAELSEGFTNWGASMNKATILHDWIIANVIAGNCQQAQNLVPRLVDAMSKPDMVGEARNYVKQDLRQVLGQYKSCSINTSALGI
jgi:hypothetical protein